MEFYILAAVLSLIPGITAFLLSYTMPVICGIHIYEYYPIITGFVIVLFLFLFKYFVFDY